MTGPSPRGPRGERPLTPGERAELSAGLVRALDRQRVSPMIVGRAHPAAHIGRLRFGSTPIMVVGNKVWWPGARADFAGTPYVARLQHELQHVLDFADGHLTIAGYLLHPGNWTYRWRPDQPLVWSRLGAEQRASVAEAFWSAERSPDSTQLLEMLRHAIPWAK